jgi:hypothetical protein
MPHRHYPPAYLRYLKARLWNLGRPSFWVTAIVLSVVGLVTWEFMSNPDVFTRKQNQETASPKVAESSLSAEDRAAVADIDNLPILIKDFEQATLAAALSIPEENSKANNSQSLFDEVISQQASATNVAKSNPGLGIVNPAPTLKQNNPFIVQADNLLQMRSGYSNNPLLAAKSLTASSKEMVTATTPFNQEIGLANQTTINQNPFTTSPLQSAINQSPNQNIFGFNSTTSSPTNIMGTASSKEATSVNQNLSGFNSPISSPSNIMGTASYNGATTPPTNGLPSETLPPNTNLNTGTSYTQPTATNLPQNSYTNFNNSQLLPNGIPATSVTPPITSAATTNISPYSTPTSIPGVVNPATPSVYGNYGVQQPTQLPQSKISLPRPTPGPYGGVQINGYTYP